MYSVFIKTSFHLQLVQTDMFVLLIYLQHNNCLFHFDMYDIFHILQCVEFTEVNACT